MSPIVVVCHGREVDDHGRPLGERCGRQFDPPPMSTGRWQIDHPLSEAWRPPTAHEVANMAIAGGWAVLPDQPDDEVEQVGMCPSCRKPPREVLALVKEVARRGTS